MGFYDISRRLVVGNRDTFAIPFVISHHVPIEGETFVFTIRRVLETTKRMGRPPEKGDILFQQTITTSQLNPIRDEDGVIRSCYFHVTATKEEAALIPEGMNAYDLACVNADGGTEIELIPPSEFIVGEVLRYE